MWLNFFRVAFGSASGFACLNGACSWLRFPCLGFLWVWLMDSLLSGFFRFCLGLHLFTVSLGLTQGFTCLGFLLVLLRASLVHCFFGFDLGLHWFRVSFGFAYGFAPLGFLRASLL